MTEENTTSTSEAPINAAEGIVETPEAVETPVSSPEPDALQTKINVPMDKINRAFGSLKRQSKSFEERQAETAETRTSIRDEIRAEMLREYKLDPMKFGQDAGYDFQQLADIQLNDGRVSDSVKNATELELIRQELAEIKAEKVYNKDLESQRQQEANVQGYKDSLADYVKNTEEFELIRDHDAAEIVFSVINEHFNNTYSVDAQGNIVNPGEVLEMKDACRYVEDYLNEQEAGYVERASRRRQAQNPVKEGEQTAGATLSNGLSSQVPTNSSNSGKTMSREESLQQAAAKLAWRD